MNLMIALAFYVDTTLMLLQKEIETKKDGRAVEEADSGLLNGWNL